MPESSCKSFPFPFFLLTLSLDLLKFFAESSNRLQDFAQMIQMGGETEAYSTCNGIFEIHGFILMMEEIWLAQLNHIKLLQTCEIPYMNWCIYFFNNGFLHASTMTNR